LLNPNYCSILTEDWGIGYFFMAQGVLIAGDHDHGDRLAPQPRSSHYRSNFS
jgi:hypothetical protein